MSYPFLAAVQKKGGTLGSWKYLNRPYLLKPQELIIRAAESQEEPEHTDVTPFLRQSQSPDRKEWDPGMEHLWDVPEFPELSERTEGAPSPCYKKETERA